MLRDFMAYGFSVLPEAIDVLVRTLNSTLEEDTPTELQNNAVPTVQRLLGEEDAKPIEDLQEGHKFSEFSVDFNDLTYPIDNNLVQTLIEHRAFDGVDDGRHRELGRIKIIGFNLEQKGSAAALAKADSQVPQLSALDQRDSGAQPISVLNAIKPFVIVGLGAISLAVVTLFMRSSSVGRSNIVHAEESEESDGDAEAPQHKGYEPVGSVA